jgi:superfamily II DNA/RNA helicase
MPPRVARLAADALAAPVRVAVGGADTSSAPRIQQHFFVLPSRGAKLAWLRGNLPRLVDAGDVLIFVAHKAAADELAAEAAALGCRAAALHGDMGQPERAAALAGLRAGATHVLAATDVAARGLDVRSVRSVVSFDAARDADTHTHRVGRTGRAGDEGGEAFTLLLESEARQAAALVGALAAAGAEAPPELAARALRAPRAAAAAAAAAVAAAGAAAGWRQPAGSALPPQGLSLQSHSSRPPRCGRRWARRTGRRRPRRAASSPPARRARARRAWRSWRRARRGRRPLRRCRRRLPRRRRGCPGRHRSRRRRSRPRSRARARWRRALRRPAAGLAGERVVGCIVSRKRIRVVQKEPPNAKSAEICGFFSWL